MKITIDNQKYEGLVFNDGTCNSDCPHIKYHGTKGSYCKLLEKWLTYFDGSFHAECIKKNKCLQCMDFPKKCDKCE